MEMSNVVRDLQGDVAAIAALGDPAVAQAGERIASALEGTLRARVLELLTQAAAEVSAQVPGRVDLRLDGGDATLVFEPDTPGIPDAAGDEAATARLTLRLPEDLKRRAEEAAQRVGISLNTWFVRAAIAAVDAPSSHGPRTSGKTMRGWAAS
jgi:hypothetical protein